MPEKFGIDSTEYFCADQQPDQHSGNTHAPGLKHARRYKTVSGAEYAHQGVPDQEIPLGNCHILGLVVRASHKIYDGRRPLHCKQPAHKS